MCGCLQAQYHTIVCMQLEEASGKILKKLRIKANISQEELAHCAGLHTNSISFFERGLRKPSLYTIFALSKVLNVKVTAFVEQVASLKPDVPVTKPSKRKQRP